jgi:hypothetical protein
MKDNETLDSQFTVEWKDSGRAPRCEPDPRFPDGMDLDATLAVMPRSCVAMLPYPAARCGAYLITCKLCGIKVACTTAGRADDPRSIKMSCKNRPQPH